MTDTDLLITAGIISPPPKKLFKTDQEEDRRETQAETLIRLAQAAQLFHAQAGDCYALIEVDSHKECWPVRSKGFKKWLCREYFRETEGRAPNSEAIQNALNIIDAQAQFDGPQVEVFTRTAEIDGKIYVDLCSEDWEAVEISESGWRVVSDPPVRFRRAEGMLPLPRPVGGGNLDELRGFVNVPDERTWILLVYWHIGCFHPRGPYPVLVLQGEHGSGKATLRVLRELIDPNLSATRTTPRDERDLAIAAKNAWVVALDNLSGLQTWLSDALCRLSTGAGFSTRRLYTDDEETLFYAKRPVVVNGIDEIINRNDLLDRSLIVNLPTIPETQRKREDEFWQEFKKARPFLLGALYDAIQIALANRNLVVLDKLPRMADFAAWVVAAEPALPWDSGGFIAAYSGMREDAVSLALEEDTIAQGVIRLVKDEPWEGTATDLLAALEELAGTKITASKSWPKSPRTLSNRLRRAATFLRQGANIEIEFERQPRSGKRLIRISKQNSVSTVTSVAREQKSLLSGTFNGDDKGDAKLQTSEFASHPASQ